MKIDDAVYMFIDALDFDDLKRWAEFLGVDYEEPPIDDMYPDWEAELRTEMVEVMGREVEQDCDFTCPYCGKTMTGKKPTDHYPKCTKMTESDRRSERAFEITKNVKDNTA